MVDIRPMQPDDWPTLRPMRLAALADAPRCFGSNYAREAGLSDDEWQVKARQWTEPDRCITLLAFDGGACCGISAAFAIPDDPAIATIASMWVRPSHRRQKLARRMLADLERWARQRESFTLRLHVTSENPAARALYQAADFALTGQQQPHVSLPGLVEFEMIKPLV